MHEASEAREADRWWWMPGCFCAVGCGGAVEGVVALFREAQFCGEGADVVFVVGEALCWEGNVLVCDGQADRRGE